VARDSCAKYPGIVLSPELVMAYVLRHSSAVGRLKWGRIERDGPVKLNVYYDGTGELIEYFSGTNIRSWCVFGPDGQPVEGWCEVLPEDLTKIPTSSAL
jgi:hypothetical protein